MSQLHDQLSQAAGRNRELLATLSQTDYASPALEQNLAYIRDLTTQLSQTEAEIARLHKITEKEHKDHSKISDSVVRRYLHKLGGHKGEARFKSAQEKEEREFVEAWQREREAQGRRDALAQALEHAEQQKQTQDADKTRHDQAQQELDQMYQSIFSGPTPDVPGEDDREQAVAQAREGYRQCETMLGNETQALNALHKAGHLLHQARVDMANAGDMSTMDMFGGGTMTDMMERDWLSRGQVKLSECLRMMDAARHAQPAIPELSEVHIDQGHIMSDVFFDCIFTDMAQHERIKASTAQMDRAIAHLKHITEEQNGRLQQAKQNQQQASQQLESARQELQRIRSEAFNRLGGAAVEGVSQPYGSAPPAYSVT